MTATPASAANERDLFENWARSKGLIAESFGIMSISGHCDTAWEAWQAARAIPQPAAEPVAYRVAEFWSSANPGKKCRMLAEGDDIVQWAKRGDFIRWVDAAPDRAPSADSAADGLAIAAEIEAVHIRFLAAVLAANGARLPLDICHIPDGNGRMVWAAMQELDFVDLIGSVTWLLTDKGRAALSSAIAAMPKEAM